MRNNCVNSLLNARIYTLPGRRMMSDLCKSRLGYLINGPGKCVKQHKYCSLHKLPQGFYCLLARFKPLRVNWYPVSIKSSRRQQVEHWSAWIVIISSLIFLR